MMHGASQHNMTTCTNRTSIDQHNTHAHMNTYALHTRAQHTAHSASIFSSAVVVTIESNPIIGILGATTSPNTFAPGFDAHPANGADVLI